MRRLFEGGAYSSNYCNWQLKSLLHLGQIVITFRTLLHVGQNVLTFRTLLLLGPFITFRPCTDASKILKLFMAGLFIGFLVEKCAACQSHRKSDFGWIAFTHFPSCLMRIIKRVKKSLRRL